VFNSKIDKFTAYDNKIADLRTREVECFKMIQGLEEQISNMIDEKRDYGIKRYLDKRKREELLEKAEEYGYSLEKINELRRYVEEWNQDCVTIDVLDSFKVIEEFVKNNQEPYKSSIMYKFSKLTSNERGI